MLRRLALVSFIALVGAAAAAQDALPSTVLQALREAGVPPESFAAVALPLTHAARPWRHRVEVPMAPASTMKLVTSIVALDRLGTSFRGSTELRSAAPLVGGMLQGDLVLKGGADPDLGVPQFWALLLELKQQGISTIAGDLLIDRTLFRPPRMDLGVPPFDETPEFAYNDIPDAVQLAGNLLTLDLSSTADTLRVQPLPALPGLDITSRMTLLATPCDGWEDGWKPATVQRAGERTSIELQGSYPANCTQRIELQVIDRVELAERLMRTLWQGLGGTWAGHARDAATPADARLLARRESRPWGELLRGMNKQSDNVLARLLFLQLGVPQMAAAPQATTAELAAREVRRWLAERHIDARGLVLDNGSGLSRSERITPLQLASMLKVAHASPWAPDLLMSLPVAGVDGTARTRLTNSPAAGWARLKGGTLRNVVSLAGYVRDPQGRTWAVAMMVNHDNASRARGALFAWVDSFAREGPQRLQRQRQAKAR